MYQIIVKENDDYIICEDNVELFKISKINSLENVIKFIGGKNYEIKRIEKN